MEVTTIRISFSLIGNMETFLKNENSQIKSFMSDYSVETKPAKLENGTTIEAIRFSKSAVKVGFLPNRIDFTYMFSKEPDEADIRDVKYEASMFFYNLGIRFPSVRANRLACVSNSFINNDNNAAIKYMTENMGLISRFGSSNELSFKINTPVKSFELLNSVVDVSMGEAKNNKTGDVVKCLLLALDVNTMANNKEPRFSPARVSGEFDKFCDLICDRIHLIERM